MATIVDKVLDLPEQMLGDPRILSAVVDEVQSALEEVDRTISAHHLIRRLIESNLVDDAERLTRSMPIGIISQAAFLAEIGAKRWEAGETSRLSDLIDESLTLARSIDNEFACAATLEMIANALRRVGHKKAAVDLFVEASLSLIKGEEKYKDSNSEDEQVYASNCAGLLFQMARKLAELGEWEKAFHAVNSGQVDRDQQVWLLRKLQSQQR